MMRTVAVAALVLVVACAARRMDAWIGQPEYEVLGRWGAPDARIVQRDGTHVLRWSKDWLDGDTHTCRKSLTIARDGRVSAWAMSDCDTWTAVPFPPHAH